MPLVGSEANECTEINIPERTKKVPSKLNEKEIIANKMLIALNNLL
jgi:hypothetical protein